MEIKTAERAQELLFNIKDCKKAISQLEKEEIQTVTVSIDPPYSGVEMDMTNDIRKVLLDRYRELKNKYESELEKL